MVQVPTLEKVVAERYEVPSRIEEGQVGVGIAVSVEDQVGRLCVATERYKLQGYLEGIKDVNVNLTPSDVLGGTIEDFEGQLDAEQLEEFRNKGLVVHFPNGEMTESFYIDPYLWQSVPIVAKDSKGQYIASARIIIADKPLKLPTLTAPEIHIEDIYKEEAENAPAEFSQLAKVKDGHSGAMLGLLRIAQLYSKEVGIDSWLATTDNHVMRLLNGHLNFNILPIGEPVDYLGSTSTPGLINIEGSLECIARNGNPDLAKFLRGENGLKGYEWYKGL